MAAKKTKGSARRVKDLPAKMLGNRSARQVKGGNVSKNAVVSEKIGPDHTALTNRSRRYRHGCRPSVLRSKRSGVTKSRQRGRRFPGGFRGKVDAETAERRVGSLKSYRSALTGANGVLEGTDFDPLRVPIAAR